MCIGRLLERRIITCRSQPCLLDEVCVLLPPVGCIALLTTPRVSSVKYWRATHPEYCTEARGKYSGRQVAGPSYMATPFEGRFHLLGTEVVR